MLSEDFFTNESAALLNPMSNIGVNRSSSQERSDDGLFVSPDQIISGCIREGSNANHSDILPSGKLLSMASFKKLSAAPGMDLRIDQQKRGERGQL
jgi:hypothetical protein